MLQQSGVSPEVLAEAVLRIIHTREQSTYPAFAIIRRMVREVEAEQSARAGGSEKHYSYSEGRELAVRRLKLQDQPVSDETVERELARMTLLGLHTAGVDLATAAVVCGWAT